jgi:hypothetical protein
MSSVQVRKSAVGHTNAGDPNEGIAIHPMTARPALIAAAYCCCAILIKHD